MGLWRRSVMAAVLVLGSAAAAAAGEASANAWTALRFEPSEIVLASPGASQRYVISARDQTGAEADVTADCRVTSSDPGTVAVDPDGMRLTARAPGSAGIQVSLGDLRTSARVEVRNQSSELAVSFTNDIISILTIKGCNGSGCHGSPAGQNGFKLSLYGDDPAADHEMIVHKHDGRRVNLEDPEQSLLLKKPTFQIAHGGGRLMGTDSEEYQTLLEWLKQGAPFDEGGVELTRLELYPRERVLAGAGVKQRLAVVGRLSDGTTRDMTGEVRYFSSNEEAARVETPGVAVSGKPGLAAVGARAMGKVATSQIGVIAERAGEDFPVPPPNNFIDELVFAKLRQMNVRPAPLSSGREFVRRVYLDTIGLLPTREELHAFLRDPRPDKRARLIDELLERDEHALLWTVRFEDWFRNIQLHMQGRNQGVFKDWVRDWLVGGHSYAEFVRRLLTSQGDTMRNPAANFWFPATDFMQKEFSVNKITPTVTRLFMGVRMECAECHNHPLENYTQDDFYGMAAFFARLRVKHGLGAYRRTWYLAGEGEVKHPLTQRPVEPKFLGGEQPEIPEDADRREALAEWITSPENPLFAQATVNRIWHEYFQTGIVEPFDDFRSTNPPSNPELLKRLAQYFVDSGYRLKPLHRLILNSRTYQLSSAGPEPEKLERTLFARYMPGKLSAEVFLDVISQVTEVPHPFGKYPEGTSAKELYIPDNPDYFLVTFGVPRRDILKDRVETPTLAQALHMMNGPTVREKVQAEDNVLGGYLAEGLSDGEIVERLYERAYGRPPDSAERRLVAEYLEGEREAGRNRRRALENVLWAVLNSKEFHLNH